jgi:hypothetical protein
MTHAPPFSFPPHVPPVEPDLLASAVFLFGEYLSRVGAEPVTDEDEDEDEDDEEEDGGGQEIDTSEVLNLFAEELGSSVATTITLYMRVTALYRLLAASPSLTQLAIEDPETGGALTDEALVAAARLDLHVQRSGDEGAADFDAREFREALHLD